MRYRPWSSVTTIFTNLVGRSLVSAITHTPASGPFELATTPAMSAFPTLTAAAFPPARILGSQALNSAARPRIRIPGREVLLLIFVLLRVGHRKEALRETLILAAHGCQYN